MADSTTDATAASAAATTTFATTPPAAGSLTLGTTNEAALISSLAGTNTAAAGTWVAPFSSYSAGPQASTTVTVNGYTGSSASSTTTTGGWSSLSSTTKYAIYAAAGAVALLLVALITWLIVRSKRKSKQARLGNTDASTFVNRSKAARMTQRSSFASPMNLDTYNSKGGSRGAPPHSGSMTSLQAPLYGNGGKHHNLYHAGDMSRAETFDSTDKNRYGAGDAYSVHSSGPPQYNHRGAAGANDDDFDHSYSNMMPGGGGGGPDDSMMSEGRSGYGEQYEPVYPPSQSGMHANQASYGTGGSGQQQQRMVSPQRAQFTRVYAQGQHDERSSSPVRHAGRNAVNPYAAFANDYSNGNADYAQRAAYNHNQHQTRQQQQSQDYYPHQQTGYGGDFQQSYDGYGQAQQQQEYHQAQYGHHRQDSRQGYGY